MTKNVLGTPARKALAALAVTATLIVPLVLFGGTALARTMAAVGQYEYSGSGQYQYGGSSGHQYRVGVCHHTHSRKHTWVMIFINWHAMKAHLKHGDTAAPCQIGRFEHAKHHGHSEGDGENERGHDQKTTFTPSSTPVTSSSSQGNGHDNGGRGHGGGGGGGGGDHGGGGHQGGGDH